MKKLTLIFLIRLWNSIIPSRQFHWRISLRVCRSVVVLRPSGIRRLWWLAWGDLWELLSLTLCWIWLLSRVMSHSNATPALSPSYWRQPEKEILNQDLLLLYAPLNNWELKMSCHMPFSLAACCIFKVILLVTTNVTTLKTMQETTRPFDKRYAAVFGKWKLNAKLKPYLFHLIKEQRLVVEGWADNAALCATQSFANLTQFSRKRRQIDGCDLLFE